MPSADVGVYSDSLRDAEHSMVGIVLIDPTAFDEANLRPEQFFDQKLQQIWRVFSDLQREGGDVTDTVQIGDRLTFQGAFNALIELAANAPHAAHTERYSTKIRESWLVRECKLITSSLVSLEARGASGAEMVDSLRGKLDALENASIQTLPTMSDLVSVERSNVARDLESIRRGERIIFGLNTGLGIERIVPGGIPNDKVTTIFGESGNFKTTLKNNIIWGIAKAGHGVLDVSYEDSDLLTTQRFLAAQTGIPYGKIATRVLTAEEEGVIAEVDAESIKVAGRVIMAGEVAPNIDEVVRVARHYKRTRGIGAVVIDYVQLLGSEKKDLDYIMRTAQLSAKRDRLAYIFVSQVKQDIDRRAADGSDPRPRISDMIGSSFMRFAPKLSMGLFRPALYWPEPNKKSWYYEFYTQHPRGAELYPQILELWILKNVLGEPRVCLPCLVNPTTGRMVEMPAEMKAMLKS